MVLRPDVIGVFEFIALARLRAQQLAAGSVPRVEGDHSIAVLAQMEVAAGKIQAVGERPDPGGVA